MKMKQIIKAMLEDDRIVLNTRTLEETEEFVIACREMLSRSYDLLSGRDCYSIYGDQTCFTLEFGVLEHADREYFEEDFKDYNIVTIEELLG